MKANKRLGLNKNVRNRIRLQNEIKNWDQRLHSLHLAVNYKESGTQEDMEAKVIQWRNYAQKAALELLPYFQEHARNLSTSDRCDYEPDDSFPRTVNDLDGNLLNEMDSSRHEELQNEKSAGSDDMSTMLTAIGINPDTLHYSSELGDFY